MDKYNQDNEWLKFLETGQQPESKTEKPTKIKDVVKYVSPKQRRAIKWATNF